MDEKIEKAIEKLIAIYEKIENDLLIEIASHFSFNEEFLNSDHWRIKKLEEMGLFDQDIVNYLARETKHTDKEIKKALSQIGIDTVNLNKLNKLFEDEVLKINPNILVDNYTIKNIIKSSYDALSDTLIQMSNKIERGVREAYLNIVEQAYLKTSMGTHSYQEAIREAINDLSNSGIKTLTYKTVDESGNIIGIRNYDIESAIRREVLTSSRQLSNAIAMETAKELDCEYLYLSEHLQCRPTHFEWQGTIIKTEDLVRITNYGEIDGLSGINCRHYFEPYFGEARDNDLKHFNKDECTDAYNLSQKQRYLEKGVRKWKRKAEMFKANKDIEAYTKSKNKVKEWQLRNKQFSEDNDLKRDFNKEYVNESKKQLLSYQDITKELFENAVPNSHKIQDRRYYEYDGIKFNVDGKNVVLDYSQNEKDIAEWLENTFGGKLYMIPRINYPDGISTPDYFWNDEYWDLKKITGNGKHTLDSAIKKKKSQSKNFIFDITDSEMKMKEVSKQVQRIMASKDRQWINKVLVKKGKIVKAYKKRD